MMPPDRKIVADEQRRRRREPRPDEAQPHEEEGDDRGGEDLEEPFDPQVNHPPAPVFDHREVRVLAPRQARTVEEGDGAGREQRRSAPAASARPAARSAGRITRTIRNSQSSRPTNSADLPDAAQVDVLVPLMAEVEGSGVATACCGRSATARPATRRRRPAARTKRTLTPSRWPFGSSPLTSGPMNSPAASQAVAIQNRPSCTCHVRVTL